MFWLAFSWLISLFSKSSKMADGPNLFDMTKSAINALKKPEIVKKIIELKDKLVVGEEIKSLCTHIKELTDTVNQLLSKNERLSSDLAIQKTVCGNLEKKVKSLEIQISKDEQYNHHNCVEFSSIPETMAIILKIQLSKLAKILISV